MRRILVSVEGQTEEIFVRAILAEHLQKFEILPVPIIVATKITKQGNKFRGGLSAYRKVRNDVCRLLGDSNAMAITTMYDYYKLPSDFPGYLTIPSGNSVERVGNLEAEFQRDIADPRFKPYLQLHEYEMFLFVRPEITARWFPDVNKTRELEKISKGFNSPEEIDDGETTSPSKRILSLYPRYDKTLDGPPITKEVGLENIRTHCPHFNAWLTWFEWLGSD